MGLPAERLERRRHMEGAQRGLNLVQSFNSSAFLLKYIMAILIVIKKHLQAYIYWNKSNGVWWIDEPSGNGVYIAKAPSWAPPQTGWKALGPFGPLPSLIATFRDL